MLRTIAELDAFLRAPKTAHNWSGFRERSNHVGHLIGTAQLADEDGVFVPGITLEIEVKKPLVADRCLFVFTIMQRVGTKRLRAYQLEVCPRDKRSHNGDPVVYGPHEHRFEEEVNAVDELGVNCNSWSGAFHWFLTRVNVRVFEVEQLW